MTRTRPLRGIVDLSDRFRHIPMWVVLGFAVSAALILARVWSHRGAGLVVAAFCVADGIMLALLPRLGRSFGPPQLPWISLILIRLTLALPLAMVPGAAALPVMFVLQLGLWCMALYACWIEPMQLGISRVNIRTSRLKGCPPLRILQISDLHVERITGRERRLLEAVAELQPDLIAITGDFVNISYTDDPEALEQTKDLLDQLRASGGVFIIRGSPSVDPPGLVAQLATGLDVTWLRDEVASIDWHGSCLHIAGVECSYDLDDDEMRLRRVLDGRAGECFTVLLYHTPDLMPAAAQIGVDLYLAGHTHGGQLRLPGYGALVTASNFGKRYEMGRYKQDKTTLYVNRGVGLEGKGAPRARFLCPPEIALFTLEADSP
jgi:predicted MPP superfamily phosphohydrolase